MKGTGGFAVPQNIIEALEIPSGTTVADFGSGAGYFTLPIARKVGNSGTVYAIDVLSSALDAVESRAKQEGLFMVRTIRADLERPDGSTLAEESVDIVLAANILFQVAAPGRDTVLKEAYRILRPGGKLILIDWNDRSAGLGPPAHLRVPEREARARAEAQQFHFAGEMPVDAFHYGCVFEK